MQYDPTGFLRVFALLGDTELAQAHHHHFDPTDGLGHPVRGSSDYCMADGQMACGWAEDWMMNYFRDTHHLTWNTIEKVRLHLKEFWTAPCFLDAINPGSKNRLKLDLTIAQLRTAQDVSPPLNNAMLCSSLLAYGEDQCNNHLAPDKAARVLDRFSSLMLADMKSAARSVIDGMILAEIQDNRCSASAAASEQDPS
jgi:hypothetical protein